MATFAICGDRGPCPGAGIPGGLPYPAAFLAPPAGLPLMDFPASALEAFKLRGFLEQQAPPPPLYKPVPISVPSVRNSVNSNSQHVSAPPRTSLMAGTTTNFNEKKRSFSIDAIMGKQANHSVEPSIISGLLDLSPSEHREIRSQASAFSPLL